LLYCKDLAAISLISLQFNNLTAIESPPLRQQVIIAREVTGEPPFLSHLAAYFAILRPRPVAEKTTYDLLEHKHSEIL
jgi:hypothetical protein